MIVGNFFGWSLTFRKSQRSLLNAFDPSVGLRRLHLLPIQHSISLVGIWVRVEFVDLLTQGTVSPTRPFLHARGNPGLHAPTDPKHGHPAPARRPCYTHKTGLCSKLSGGGFKRARGSRLASSRLLGTMAMYHHAGGRDTPTHGKLRCERGAGARDLGHERAAHCHREPPEGKRWSCGAVELDLGYPSAHPNGQGPPHRLSAPPRTRLRLVPALDRTARTLRRRTCVPLRAKTPGRVPILGVTLGAASRPLLAVFAPPG